MCSRPIIDRPSSMRVMRHWMPCSTMPRRDVRHSLRNLTMPLRGLRTPTIMLVLFNYVFGGAVGAGLGGAAHGGAYINSLAPGIIAMTVGSGCATTALNLCQDL